MYSTNEVSEYHAELMLASKEDEGATIRIEELERRGALAEHGARRITNVVLRSRKSTRTRCTTFKDYLGILNHVFNRCNMTVALLGV